MSEVSNDPKFPLTDEQVLDFADGNDDVLADYQDELYTYYTHHAHGPDAMPYGVAKARTGDPDQWIADRLYERAKAIRFFTDTSHPSVGDGNHVCRDFEISQGGITLRGRGNAAAAAVLLNDVVRGFTRDGEVITDKDLDDGTGVGLLPSIDHFRPSPDLSSKEYGEEQALKSTYANPIWYRGYRIFVPDYVPGAFAQFQYQHDSYDGAEDSCDNRAGHARDVAEAKAEIDELEDE